MDATNYTNCTNENHQLHELMQTEMKIQGHQNRKLHWLLKELRIDKEVKEELVYAATQGRSHSSSDLTAEEANTLIMSLASDKQRMASKPKTKDEAMERMRRKIISIGHEMNWKLSNGKIDMARVNDFCVLRGHKHVVLNQYRKNELPLLITQFEKLLKDYYAKREI